MASTTRITSSSVVTDDPVAALLVDLYRKDPLLPRTALQVRVEPTLSRPGQPLQYGVYACVDIPSGTRVCWYGGVLMHKNDIDAAQGTSHVRSMGGGYVLNGNVYSSQLKRGAGDLAPSDPKGDEDPSHFIMQWGTPGDNPLLPIGFMCNTSGARTGNNVRIRTKRLTDLLDVSFLQATANIQAGAQILCNYGNLHSPNHTDAFVAL